MIISIDGACKGNGTPECKSVGAAVIVDKYSKITVCTRFESNESSNQRGELLGLCEALLYACSKAYEHEPIYIVTDSEFIYNSVQKEWCFSWPKKGWVTSMMEPIKNQDLWAYIVTKLESIDMDDVTMIYMKGHTIPYTKLQARKDSGVLVDSINGFVKPSYECKPDLEKLHACIAAKFKKYSILNRDKIEKYEQTVERINGYKLDDNRFAEFAVLNMLTDLMATITLDDAVETLDRCNAHNYICGK